MGKIMKPEPWVNTKEIAEHMGVTVETVRKWIKLEKIPCHRIGKLWKFKVNEVDEWTGNRVINKIGIYPIYWSQIVKLKSKQT